MPQFSHLRNGYIFPIHLPPWQEEYIISRKLKLHEFIWNQTRLSSQYYLHNVSQYKLNNFSELTASSIKKVTTSHWVILRIKWCNICKLCGTIPTTCMDKKPQICVAFPCIYKMNLPNTVINISHCHGQIHYEQFTSLIW